MRPTSLTGLTNIGKIDLSSRSMSLRLVLGK